MKNKKVGRKEGKKKKKGNPLQTLGVCWACIIKYGHVVAMLQAQLKAGFPHMKPEVYKTIYLYRFGKWSQNTF